MTVEIISNGSKWAGEQPDDIDMLLERLRTCTLDPKFERYGNFAHEETADDVLPGHEDLIGTWHVHGNFYDFSHVFSIRGTRDELAVIVDAIRENQATSAYAQAKREQEARESERAERDRAQRDAWTAARERELRALLDARGAA